MGAHRGAHDQVYSAAATEHVERAKEALRNAAEQTNVAAREMLAAGAVENDLEAFPRGDRASIIGHAKIAIELARMSAKLERWGAEPEEARSD